MYADLRSSPLETCVGVIVQLLLVLSFLMKTKENTHMTHNMMISLALATHNSCMGFVYGKEGAEPQHGNYY
jgi:hypothetical protein